MGTLLDRSLSVAVVGLIAALVLTDYLDRRREPVAPSGVVTHDDIEWGFGLRLHNRTADPPVAE